MRKFSKKKNEEEGSISVQIVGVIVDNEMELRKIMRIEKYEKNKRRLTMY